MTTIIIARAYLTEGDKLLKTIMSYLHDEIKVDGVTVFRAISGFGKSGTYHSTELLTMSLDLPLVVEFFGEEHKIKQALAHLKTILKPGHIIYWKAEIM